MRDREGDIRGRDRGEEERWSGSDRKEETEKKSQREDTDSVRQQAKYRE
jgi:hypothetical protein